MFGFELAYKETVQGQFPKRIGSIPGYLALNAADIGEATLGDGTKVTTTWGRNLDNKEQQWYLENTNFRPIWIGADNGSADLIIPEPIAQQLREIVTPKTKSPELHEIPDRIVEIYRKRNMWVVTGRYADRINGIKCGCLLTALYATDREIDECPESDLHFVIREKAGLNPQTFQGLLDGFDNDPVRGDRPTEYHTAFNIGRKAYQKLEDAGLVLE